MENENCTELEAILDRLSCLLDKLYEYTDDRDEQNYINSVENELHSYLVEKGLLNDD